MRADPDLFDVFRWAREGTLPNIAKMMERGSYGFAIPVFPSHTPVNFATLLTGKLPKKHYVADGPMHTEGNPLNKVSIGGFSSAAKKAEPIWVTLERARKSVFLLSVPGSTPPELERGVTVRGRWGGWGADFHPTIFEEKADNPLRYRIGREARLFAFGPPLTVFESGEPADRQWENVPPSFSAPLQVSLSAYGATSHAYVYDSTDDGVKNHDRILFSYDKKRHITDLGKGEWSDWKPFKLAWRFGKEAVPVDSFVRIKIVRLDGTGMFRIRFLYDNLNEYIVHPSGNLKALRENIGPMVDFVDNFPPQLIYYPEDKETFLEEMNFSFEWHFAATDYILVDYSPDVLISDIYSPNQMLTSRWWLGYIDPRSARYNDVDEKERARLWNEVLDMYRKIDDIVGVLLENADDDAYVVLSSDHGACPLNRSVRLNNLFAEKGWLRFTVDKETGEPVIDWRNSTVIYLKMLNIYVSPSGLSGDWRRGSGGEYERLRDEVVDALRELKDPETGERPVAKIVKWEEADRLLDLPKERVGDLVVANASGYGWNEEVTESKEVFTIPLVTGYKQAIPPSEKCLWTPFLIAGPGVRKDHMIRDPIYLQDQHPTILRLLGEKVDPSVDGRVVEEILR